MAYHSSRQLPLQSARSACSKLVALLRAPSTLPSISYLTAQALHQSLQQSESAVDSDTKAEYVDESAIYDDDSSDWVNSDTEEVETKSQALTISFFQRVEPMTNLLSRSSRIMPRLAQNERAGFLDNQPHNLRLPFTQPVRRPKG